MNQIKVKFEVEDIFSDKTTEITKIEKSTYCEDSQIIELIDIFVKFIEVYGLSKNIINQGFKEWSDEYEGELNNENI